jgi:hypothetical protein
MLSQVSVKAVDGDCFAMSEKKCGVACLSPSLLCIKDLENPPPSHTTVLLLVVGAGSSL